MKRLILLFLTLFLLAGVYAQAPQRMRYQAVVRDANNALVVNQNVSVRVTVLRGSATGAVVYAEVHNIMTDENGLLTLEVGGGNMLLSSFETINWGTGPFFMKTEIDPTGGSNYSLTTTQQLMSVPYALYAAASANGDGPQGPAGLQGPQGEPGPQGVVGPQGPQGLPGTQGSNGVSPTIFTSSTATGTNVSITDANGTSQFFVPNGAEGAVGPQGSQGPVGQDGGTGLQGPEGPQGTVGLQGAPGNTGLQGPQGESGISGVSPTITTTTTATGTYVSITDADGTHQFFVPNGVNGNQGLQGPQGEPGDLGAPGEQGPVGPQGEQGVSPVVTIQPISNGNLVIIASATSIDTFTVLNGEPGPQGEPGGRGPAGLQGIPGTQGPLGLQGEPGEPGVPGLVGSDGVSPVLTMTNLDPMRTQVTITSAAHPEGQSFIVKNGISTSPFLQEQVNWLETDITANSYIQNKPAVFDGDYNHLSNLPELSNLAVTGSYHSLTNQPTIPAAANDATLTIQKNGVTVGTFTADAAVDDTINITVPTTIGELVNDIGYITAAEVPTQVSQLTNDANYVNNTDCPTVNFCDLYNAMTALQNAMDSTQNSYNGYIDSYLDSLTNLLEDMENTIAARDSIFEDWNAQLNPFVCGTTTVKDHEGNVYHTVKIGDQCWTRENMRATTSPSTGSYLVSTAFEQMSYTGKKAYWYNNDSISYAPRGYGLLYNWNAAMDTFNTEYSSDELSIGGENDALMAIFSGARRGICPKGWHVPSYAEWTQMTDYVSGQSQYLCGNNSTYISKALASTLDWMENTVDCAVGNNLAANNATGFSALPVGICDGSCYFGSSYTYFWSTTQVSKRTVNGFLIGFYSPEVNFEEVFKYDGVSVRCLRDGGLAGALADNEADGTGGETPIVTPATEPTVTTAPVTEITATTAVSGGEVTNDGGAAVTGRGVCWSTSTTPTIADAHTTDGAGLGTFVSNITGLTAGETYYVRAYATNSVGTAYGERLSFRIDAVLPTVTTAPVTEITATTAVSGGEVTNDGGASVTDRGVCWSTSQHPTVADAHHYSGNGIGAFTTNLTNLTAGTTYYVRAYATNSLGTAYGEQVVFTTALDLPTVTTAPVTEITATTAVSGGEVTNDGGASVTDRGVCWSTSEHPTVADAHHYSGNGIGAFTTNLTNLTAGTTYYVRAYATNSLGTAYGEQVVFTTALDLPTVTTAPVTEITATTAVSGGEVTNDGGASVTDRGVCWSTSTTPTIADAHTMDGVGLGTFVSNITGLTAGETYYVRAYATNSVGTAYGERLSFRIDAVLPTVTTAPVTEITATTAVSGGEVTNDGGASVTDRGICWSTSQHPTVADAHRFSGNGIGAFTTNLTNLTAGTTYYVRAYATNSVGTAYGEQVVFTTALDLPTVTTAPITDVTTTTAVSGGTVSADGGAAVTARGVCWSTSTTPTIADAHTTDGAGLGTFVSNITGLTAGETYYVRAYATNSVGTAYGERLSFRIDAVLPTVTTAPVTEITATTAVSGGEVTNGGGAAVTDRGICWSTSEHPTVADAHHYSGNGIGAFTTNLTNLTAGTTYYVRAYAINSVGTAYGEQVVFTTATTAPTVITSTASEITATTATCGGEVTDEGGAAVTARGVCWSTSTNPTITDAHTTDGAGLGIFTSQLSGLIPSTIYYVRAYAINSVDTVYGGQGQFLSDGVGRNPNDGQPCTNAATVTDHEGNVYNTVQVGTQCWMKENMRAVTSPTTGTYLVRHDALSSDNYTYSGKQARWCDNDSTTYAPQGYGLLYNWNAAMDTFNVAYSYDECSISDAFSKAMDYTFDGFRRGICPQGWHVPNEAEWDTLSSYVSRFRDYVCADNRNYIAKALAASYGWSSGGSCHPGNEPSSNNATGFSAVPAGYYTSSFTSLGRSADFWTSAQNGSSSAHYRSIDSYDLENTYSQNKFIGCAVRCISDETGIASVAPEGPATRPNVTTAAVTEITETTAVCGGTVTNDGGAEVTARGVCWGTSSYPTVADAHTTDGTGLGSFTSQLTGLTPSTIYYVRAYAINRADTAYGNSKRIFTEGVDRNPYDGQPCFGMDTVLDHEGNAYHTVQVGRQCWMKENMRAVTSPTTGTYLVCNDAPSSDNYTYSGKQARWCENDSTTYAPQGYGLLYNWNAAMDTFNLGYSDDELSINTNSNNAKSISFNGFRQGICPTGWHVPNESEWDTLSNYVSRFSEYICNNNPNNIAKALAASYGWSSGGSCHPGNDPSSNNATGFSAVPAGYYSSSFSSLGSRADFWTSTQSSKTSAHYRYLTYSSMEDSYSKNKSTGSSVRCISDETGIASVAPEEPASRPTVTTAAVTDVTSVSATCGGRVSDDGGAAVIARGVCWSTSSNPTIADAQTTDGVGLGTFTSALTGLTPSTRYYVRAYALNSEGIVYGSSVQFITEGVGRNPNDGQPCTGTSTVTDHEGNVYNTVQIGTQCWTKENMRAVTSPTTGTYLVRNDAPSSDNYTYSGKQARWCGNDSTTYAPQGYGLLYNWNAAMDTFNVSYSTDELSVSTSTNKAVSLTFNGFRRGICPQGWHVPNESEWDTLFNYVSRYSDYLCDDNSSYIVKALASTEGWTGNSSCTPGNDPSSNNATGFSAVPAGYCRSSYSYLGSRAYFWSATQSASSSARYSYTDTRLVYDNVSASKYGEYSVRCISDETDIANVLPATTPAVTTDAVSEVTTTTAVCGGTVTSDGGAAVTARGVCWSTSPNPTLADDHTNDGAGTGSFSSTITGLTPGTTYYVRPYATNSAGTAYGEQLSFTTLEAHQPVDTSDINRPTAQPCDGSLTVTDVDGNVYHTVKIGTQCWMLENLRTTKYADGTPIALKGEVSLSSKYRWYPNSDANTVALYGYLYNWYATMNAASSSTAVPSGVQGVCPTGWHIPSDQEWTILTDYVSSQESYLCYDDPSHIAKSLASTTTAWTKGTAQCAIGRSSEQNNKTGFSALPAGNSTFGFYNATAYLWSSSQYGVPTAYNRQIGFNSPLVYRNNFVSKSSACSVRCLRNENVVDVFAPETDAAIPTVITDAVTNITDITAVLGGNVIDDGGSMITSKGVCWSASQNPTIYEVHTTNGAGPEEFTNEAIALSPNTTYYVRAYATNAAGIAYGNQVSFTTAPSAQPSSETQLNPQDGQPCEVASTVTDVDGNVYNTVQIGSQCWTKENMRATRYADGTFIALGTDTSSSIGYRYYPNNDAANVTEFGFLYNWKAATFTSTSLVEDPDVTRGVCPNGWHVPSDAEWTQLERYVGSQTPYTCSEDSSTISQSIALGKYWYYSTSKCGIGYNLSVDNMTGFSALPAGKYGDAFASFTNDAFYWTATPNYRNGYYRHLYYDSSVIYRGCCSSIYGYSVRCIRN